MYVYVLMSRILFRWSAFYKKNFRKYRRICP